MRFLRFVWKLFVMASVFGTGYIIGREHSFEEEEMWEEEAGKTEDTNSASGTTDAPGSDSEVTFEFEDADAVKVALVGSFNDWNKDKNPMKKENGVWKCSLSLKTGKHEYQFVINDTDWIVDPKSGDAVKNKYEGANSIIEIG